ncbi:MAG: DUF1365 domain-containing protein [Rickettsiales bacterium]
MALTHTWLEATVAHARQRPAKNAFRYRVYYLCLALSQWSALHRLRFFGLEHFNLFSLRAHDYGRGEIPEAWMRSLLSRYHITSADGEIVLMTMPRILGYAFNPVSFWFCLDKLGTLRAMLADVTNTFGERHAYLLFHDDQRPITADDLFNSQKAMHVSPFIEVSGHYEFRIAYAADAIGVWIDHHDADGLLLTTSVTGKRHTLTARSLLACFFRYPLVTFKVIALIHYQALRLFLKGVRYHCKPTPPTTEISR